MAQVEDDDVAEVVVVMLARVRLVRLGVGVVCGFDSTRLQCWDGRQAHVMALGRACVVVVHRSLIRVVVCEFNSTRRQSGGSRRTRDMALGGACGVVAVRWWSVHCRGRAFGVGVEQYGQISHGHVDEEVVLMFGIKLSNVIGNNVARRALTR